MDSLHRHKCPQCQQPTVWSGLVVLGVVFAALGGGAITLAARTKQDAC